MTAGASRFDVNAPLPALSELGRVHLIAIGGAGMSAVAGLLLQSGVEVSGSDSHDSATMHSLRARGAVVHVGHDPANQAEADTVVVSSAIRDDNPELLAARGRGARVLHRAQALAVVMQGRVRVAVAGANGKTTTTAMLTVALRLTGSDPGFAIGGEPVQLRINASVGSGPAFVAEADESDGSFLVYAPDVAVVTNVQPDHLDFYGTFAAVAEAYDRFAASVSTRAMGGLLVACADDDGSARLAERARLRGQRVLTYGFSPDADVRLDAYAAEGNGSRARLRGARADRPDVRSAERRLDDGAGTELRVTVPGRHNLLNAAAAYTAAVHGLGADADGVLAALTAFGGTRRRFESVGSAGGVAVVDDYAHNPGKVAALMETARGVADGRRLVVAFQPHLYSRTVDFADDFAASLSSADLVVVTDVYAARERPVEGVTGRLVADRTARIHARGADGATHGADAGGRETAASAQDLSGVDLSGVDLSGVHASRIHAEGAQPGTVYYVAEVAALPHVLRALVRPGDLVVTVGAGDITTVGPRLLSLLNEPTGGAP